MRLPSRLVFDGLLTTRAVLTKLHRPGVRFLNLRTRTAKLVQDLDQVPPAAWRSVQLERSAGYRNASVHEAETTLSDHAGQIRQPAGRGLGREHATVRITNDRQVPTRQLIERYASRMNIEQRLTESIRPSHIDAHSSAVPLKVDLDVVLSVLAGAVCASFRRRLRGYETATPDTLQRRFFGTAGTIAVDDRSVRVRLDFGTYSRVLRGADLPKVRVPWWGDRDLSADGPAIDVNQCRTQVVFQVMAFELAFQELFGRAYRLAYRILGSGPAAEDVAAEALARAFSNWARVGRMEHRDAWVLRVATNLALDQVRMPRSKLEAAAPVELADPTDLLTLRLTLVDALRTLPARQRETLALRYFGDLTDRQIARVLRISAGTAKTHVHRGLAALRRHFADDIVQRLQADQEEHMRLRTYKDAREALEDRRIITGRVLGWGEGELLLDVGGVPGRLVASQAGFYVGDDYSWMIGNDVEVRVIDVREDEGVVFLSRRAVLDNERFRALRRAMLAELRPGETRLGKVTLVLPFGAFVDLGGVFGVLPASEFAAPDEDREQIKGRNEPGAPGPVVRDGGVRVKVVSIDLEHERAHLRLSRS